jgi:hypothetical protein
VSSLTVNRQTAGRLIARPGLVAAGAWTSVYMLLWASGQRFSTRYLDIAWQLVPIETLRSDPIGSVWRLHIQPPMWNLLVGGVLAWSPLPDSISLQAVQFAFGIISVALLASLLARLFARPPSGSSSPRSSCSIRRCWQELSHRRMSSRRRAGWSRCCGWW